MIGQNTKCIVIGLTITCVFIYCVGAFGQRYPIGVDDVAMEETCSSLQTQIGCSFTPENHLKNCGSAQVCYDDVIDQSLSSKSQGGGFSPLSMVWCNAISGTASSETIRIGSVYYWSPGWQVWYTYGDLGYCKSGVIYTCDPDYTSNPIPVKAYAGNECYDDGNCSSDSG